MFIWTNKIAIEYSRKILPSFEYILFTYSNLCAPFCTNSTIFSSQCIQKTNREQNFVHAFHSNSAIFVLYFIGNFQYLLNFSYWLVVLKVKIIRNIWIWFFQVIVQITTPYMNRCSLWANYSQCKKLNDAERLVYVVYHTNIKAKQSKGKKAQSPIMNFMLKLKCFANIYAIFHHAYETYRCSMVFCVFSLHTPLNEWKVFEMVGKKTPNRQILISNSKKRRSNEFKLSIFLSMICVHWRKGPIVLGVEWFFSCFFIGFIAAFGKVGLMNVSPFVISSCFPFRFFFRCAQPFL